MDGLRFKQQLKPATQSHSNCSIQAQQSLPAVASFEATSKLKAQYRRTIKVGR